MKDTGFDVLGVPHRNLLGRIQRRLVTPDLNRFLLREAKVQSTSASLRAYPIFAILTHHVTPPSDGASNQAWSINITHFPCDYSSIQSSEGDFHRTRAVQERTPYQPSPLDLMLTTDGLDWIFLPSIN